MSEIFPEIETIVDVLENLNIGPNKKLNKTQVLELSKYLTLNDKTKILDVLDMINIDGYEKTIKALKKNKQRFFDESSLTKKNINKQNNDIVNLYRKKKVYNSSYKCPKCGSNNVREVTKQTRSSDEGGTSFKQCQNCLTNF